MKQLFTPSEKRTSELKPSEKTLSIIKQIAYAYCFARSNSQYSNVCFS